MKLDEQNSQRYPEQDILSVDTIKILLRGKHTNYLSFYDHYHPAFLSQSERSAILDHCAALCEEENSTAATAIRQLDLSHYTADIQAAIKESIIRAEKKGYKAVYIEYSFDHGDTGACLCPDYVPLEQDLVDTENEDWAALFEEGYDEFPDLDEISTIYTENITYIIDHESYAFVYLTATLIEYFFSVFQSLQLDTNIVLTLGFHDQPTVTRLHAKS